MFLVDIQLKLTKCYLCNQVLWSTVCDGGNSSQARENKFHFQCLLLVSAGSGLQGEEIRGWQRSQRAGQRGAEWGLGQAWRRQGSPCMFSCGGSKIGYEHCHKKVLPLPHIASIPQEAQSVGSNDPLQFNQEANMWDL